MCTILLARNKVEDRTKAISYIEQALGVLQENEGDTEQFQVWVAVCSPVYQSVDLCVVVYCTVSDGGASMALEHNI